MRLALAWVSFLLVGCLPRHAVSRRDALEADRYTFEAGVTATEGYGLPGWAWQARGELVLAWSRDFRDGTIGHGVRFEGVRDATGAPLWEGAVVELRSFPSGEIVAVEGIGPWAGSGGHLELVDLLWPALSPRVPDGPRGEAVRGVAAWPVLFPAGPGPRLKVDGTWTPTAEAVVWKGRLDGESALVRYAGDVSGRYVWADDRVTDARFDSNRTVTTRWTGGVQRVQQIALSVALTHAGTTPTAPLGFAPVADDAASDATPLRYADGRAVVPGPAAGVQLPFLAVDPATAADLRATLTGMGASP